MPWRAALSASLSDARSFGKLDAIGPANQAAGLQQPGTRQRLARHQQLRPISETIGEPVGLSAEDAADGDAGLADGERAADLDAEPIEQAALDQHHAGGAPSGAGIRRLEHRDLAIERVGVVDGLHLDQRGLAGGGAGHGAEARRFAHLAQRIERRALFGVGLAVDQLEGEIAADQEASLPRQCLLERGRQRADRRHGGDAKGDAEHEDGEAAGAGAQLAQGDRERQRQPQA